MSNSLICTDTSSRLPEILYFLEDFDLKAIGTTSKAINELASQIISDRDKQLETIFNFSYSYIRKFNLKFFINAKILCLGEIHGSSSCRDAQKKVIQLLAKRGPVVCVLEGVPSLQIFTKEELEKMDILVTPISRQLDVSRNIYYTGWDDAESIHKGKEKRKELFEKPFEDRKQQTNEQIDPINNELQQLHNNLTNTFNAINKLASESEVHKRRELGEFKDSNEFLAYLESFDKISNEKDCENSFEITNKKNELHFIYEKIKELNAICDEIIKTEEEDLCFLFNQLPSQFGRYWEMLIETFPKRTMSMVETVSKISDFIVEKWDLQNARIVIISGCSHVEEKKDNANLSLDNFYQELEKNEAALLVPKVELQDKEYKRTVEWVQDICG